MEKRYPRVIDAHVHWYPREFVDLMIKRGPANGAVMGEDQHGKLLGRHRSTGIGRPRFWERAKYFGDEKRLGAALDASEIAGEAYKG